MCLGHGASLRLADRQELILFTLGQPFTVRCTAVGAPFAHLRAASGDVGLGNGQRGHHQDLAVVADFGEWVKLELAFERRFNLRIQPRQQYPAVGVARQNEVVARHQKQGVPGSYCPGLIMSRAPKNSFTGRVSGST